MGKTAEEIRAALAAGIRCFNVESEPELERLDAIAGAMGRRAPVSLRVNPDVDARTHPYISTGLKGNKFGIAHDRALAAYDLAARLPNLAVTGIDCHIGSQILEMAPLEEALERVLELAAALAARGIPIRHVDVGGGMGIRYREGEEALDIGLWCATVASRLAGTGYSRGGGARPRDRRQRRRPPLPRRVPEARQGQALRHRGRLHERAHPPGALRGVARDRPARRPRPPRAPPTTSSGPVCESSDVLGTDRSLAIAPGDGIAILSAGAYGMVMSSNYNSRPRPCEVMVDGARAVEVRPREPIATLFAGEKTLD